MLLSPRKLVRHLVSIYCSQWNIYLMYVWPCIIYENDERYQLDATIMIYYITLHVSDIYMSIFRSSGCVLLSVVLSTRCCGCGPKEPVCSLVHCVWVCIRRSRIQTHTVHKTTHRLLRTTATTPSAEHHMQQYTTWTPEDGHIDVRNM